MKKVLLAILVVSTIFVGCNNDSIVQTKPDFGKKTDSALEKEKTIQRDFGLGRAEVPSLTPNGEKIIRSSSVTVNFKVDGLHNSNGAPATIRLRYDGNSVYFKEFNSRPIYDYDYTDSKIINNISLGRHALKVETRNTAGGGMWVTHHSRTEYFIRRPNHAPTAPSISKNSFSSTYPSIKWVGVTSVAKLLDCYSIYRSEGSPNGPWVNCGQHLGATGELHFTDPAKRLAEPMTPLIETVYYKIVAVDQHFRTESNIVSIRCAKGTHSGFEKGD